MPPSKTPAAAPEPATPPQIPSALLRSAPSWKVVVTIESAAGERIAAPSPWTARAAISCPGAGGEPARQRGEREEDEAEEQDAPAAEQVGETAAEKEEATEGEDVGVDDPGQARLAEVERRADRRQRHVDDRRIEDDHELCDAEQDQGDPSLVTGRARIGHRGGLSSAGLMGEPVSRSPGRVAATA